jgi:hypothetical protein
MDIQKSEVYLQKSLFILQNLGEQFNVNLQGHWHKQK